MMGIIATVLVLCCGTSGVLLATSGDDKAPPAPTPTDAAALKASAAVVPPAATGAAVLTRPPVRVPTTPAPKLLTMPDVIGRNAAIALDELTRLGFKDIRFGTVDGRAFVVLPQNWTVKTQSEKAGSHIPPGTQITLGCAKNV
jgi:hypothetical protein